ncbi:MAG: 3-dehydroquinate synthase [Eggerthellaceae bacterium]|nr:3-dehydroquinate synthase [Eggerthellaceae bacterium]
MATKVVVNIPDEEPYDVRIGEDILKDLGPALKRMDITKNAKSLLIVSDDNVAPIYLEAAKDSLRKMNYNIYDIEVPAGENSKSVDVAAEMWEAMASLELGRDSAVIALGGGVIGDLAGFVGSTYMRGIPIVQVPTTLLAMVDSSVGGKTAINLEAGKNLVGTFTQPVYVCASTDTLDTLNDREWRCGCAEVAKSAIADSDDFFFWLLEHADDLANRDPAVVSEAIARCVIFKANVVAADKTESSGIREHLNYGHTLGHAIEAVAGYGTFSHGAAIAEGMRFAAKLSADVLGTPEDLIEAQNGLLDSLGLTPLEWDADPKALFEAMKHDKKCRGGALRFVLMADVGDVEVMNIDDDTVMKHLDEWHKEKQELQSRE